MGIRGLIVAVAAGILFIASAGARDGESPPSQTNFQKSNDKIKQLQKERIATLKMTVDVETHLFQIGKSSHEAVLEAKVLVCEAELDAAEKPSDRITALKSLVDVLKDCEELAKVRKNNAEGTEAGVLKARARRLEAEIRLEQAQAEQVEPGSE
jgi:hypothetical protein